MKPSNEEMLNFNNISIRFGKKGQDVIMVSQFFKDLMEMFFK